MTRRALLFAACIVAFFTTLQAATVTEVTLSPGTTTLEAGNTYQATADGTYTLTTNGTPVNATIKVFANVTLILDNCHIASTSDDYPLRLSENNKTLTILFKQSNQIIANCSTNPYSPIYSTASNSTLILAKAPGAQNASLFLRGSVTNASANPPIYFTSSTSSVIMRSGNITIATSARTNGTPLIPSLISTGTFKLHGGTLTAQMCPRFKANELGLNDLTGYKLQNVEGVVSPLFNCTSFTMTGGKLTTAGDKVCPYGDLQLVATEQAYDTSYAYAQTHLNNLTSATTISQTGGSICGPTAATFYGFPPNTSIPSTCFSKGSKSVTSDKNGKVSVTGAYPTLCYATSQSQAIAEVIGAPLKPTEKGILAKATLGISDIQIDTETLAPVLILALDISGDTTSTEKTLSIQVLSDTSDTPSTVILDQTITFTRASPSGHFTTSVTCPSPTTIGSTRYRIRAYN